MGTLITIEGISGSGKTYYFNKLKEKYKDDSRVIFNGEITDGNHKDYGSKIFDILFSTKSRFFDIGNPKAEALLIAAKQAFDEDNYILPMLEDDKVVISDRGFDTICIIEGIMFTRKYGGRLEDNVDMMYSTLSNFNKVPDLTIVLDGNFSKALLKAEKRDNLPYTNEEKEILFSSSLLYKELVNKSERVICINRDEDEEEVFKNIVNVIEKEIKKERRYVYEKNNISNRKLG